MSCPNCGKEILYEDSPFCPNCGKILASDADETQNELEVQQKNTDLVLAAAILTILAAAFSAGLGYIGVYQYTSLVVYYDSSVLSGFLIFAAVGLIVSAFAIFGAIFMLKRKDIKVSMLGVILLLISVVSNYVTLQIFYDYGFTDIIVMSEIVILILSVLSGIFVFTSKAEFA